MLNKYINSTLVAELTVSLGSNQRPCRLQVSLKDDLQVCVLFAIGIAAQFSHQSTLPLTNNNRVHIFFKGESASEGIIKVKKSLGRLDCFELECKIYISTSRKKLVHIHLIFHHKSMFAIEEGSINHSQIDKRDTVRDTHSGTNALL